MFQLLSQDASCTAHFSCFKFRPTLHSDSNFPINQILQVACTFFTVRKGGAWERGYYCPVIGTHSMVQGDKVLCRVLATTSGVTVDLISLKIRSRPRFYLSEFNPGCKQCRRVPAANLSEVRKVMSQMYCKGRPRLNIFLYFSPCENHHVEWLTR